MIKALDISISNEWKDIEDLRKVYRTKNYRVSSLQWPRLYSKGISSIKNKNWELRRYNPEVIESKL